MIRDTKLEHVQIGVDEVSTALSLWLRAPTHHQHKYRHLGTFSFQLRKIFSHHGPFASHSSRRVYGRDYKLPGDSVSARTQSLMCTKPSLRDATYVNIRTYEEEAFLCKNERSLTTPKLCCFRA